MLIILKVNTTQGNIKKLQLVQNFATPIVSKGKIFHTTFHPKLKGPWMVNSPKHALISYIMLLFDLSAYEAF